MRDQRVTLDAVSMMVKYFPSSDEEGKKAEYMSNDLWKIYAVRYAHHERMRERTS